MRALRRTMRPELLNRFDQIVLFSSLGGKELRAILDIMIDKLSQQLINRGIGLTLSPRLKRWLIERGSDSKYGARPLRRTIQDDLEKVIADQIISGKIRRGDIVRADLRGDTVVLIPQEEARSSSSRRSKHANQTAKM